MPKAMQNMGAHAQVRTRFITWMTTSWWLRKETVHLTVRIIDSYLASGAFQGRHHFGLLAIAALSIASNAKEQNPPPQEDLLAAMDYAYSREDLASMEAAILENTVGDVVDMPTVAQLLPLLLEGMSTWMESTTVSHVSPGVAAFAESTALPRQRGAQDDSREGLAWWFAKLALLNVRMACFSPSKIAASVVLLSNRRYKVQSEWPPAMARLCGHTRSDLRECVQLLEMDWKARRC